MRDRSSREWYRLDSAVQRVGRILERGGAVRIWGQGTPERWRCQGQGAVRAQQRLERHHHTERQEENNPGTTILCTAVLVLQRGSYAVGHTSARDMLVTLLLPMPRVLYLLLSVCVAMLRLR